MLTVVLTAALACGAAPPLKVLDPANLARLKKGMLRQEVCTILGMPVHEIERLKRSARRNDPTGRYVSEAYFVEGRTVVVVGFDEDGKMSGWKHLDWYQFPYRDKK